MDTSDVRWAQAMSGTARGDPAAGPLLTPTRVGAVAAHVPMRSTVMSDEAQEARRALQESMDRRDQGSDD
ncbi:hypothetical protein JNO54_06850 [Janibacter sp. YIM B02568]|uniref:hypothetical protein n=1 Tax=Janibacter endophyticus TaxID=2806261 RepID=UPI001950074A|nr:hypothetical protein [Janibacter endophyticus]MBM6545858.1 hypothetical protein [Janibacter endophyticus]